MQTLPQSNMQPQQMDPQLQQQILHNQQQMAQMQGQWVIPSYGTLTTGQNIIQLQPIQHVHMIQNPNALQHVMPIQMQPPHMQLQSQHHQQQQQQHQLQQNLQQQVQNLHLQDMIEQHNLQLKLPEQKAKADSDVNSESTVSRRTSSDCQMLSSENEYSSHDITPEHTLVELPADTNYQQKVVREQHRKLSQQNSLDKADGNAVLVTTSGHHPQSIADLQHKLVQLTSQPSESVSVVNTPPISHPATPHGYPGGIVQEMQQNLGTIPGLPATVRLQN